MLMPLLSVTAIGLVIGLIVGVRRGWSPASMTWSVGGAWVGFLVGGVLGGVFDVVNGSGVGVPIAGHAAAAAGALAAVTRGRGSQVRDTSSAV